MENPGCVRSKQGFSLTEIISDFICSYQQIAKFDDPWADGVALRNMREVTILRHRAMSLSTIIRDSSAS
jgi:hypothetical protein